MQGYQQRLFFVALFIIGIYGETKINFFNVYEPGKTETRANIEANRVQLWAEVTDCPNSLCVCNVLINEFDNEPWPIEFPTEKENNIGHVIISNLMPSTSYSFNLNCQNDPSPISKVLNITTDYTRPLPPQNINASIVSEHVQFTWSTPLISSEGFNHYIITIDSNNKYTIPKNHTSYNMSKEYIYGSIHTFNIVACYKNNQNITLCSKPSEAQHSFVIPVTAKTIPTSPPSPPSPPSTPTVPKTTPTQSTGIYSYSISISMIIFTLIFLSIK